MGCNTDRVDAVLFLNLCQSVLDENPNPSEIEMRPRRRVNHMVGLGDYRYFVKADAVDQRKLGIGFPDINNGDMAYGI